MKKILILTLLFIGISFVTPKIVLAACPTGVSCQNGCEYQGQCVNNKKCELVQDVLYSGPIDCGSAQLGSVQPPGFISAYNNQAQGNGLITFISRLVNFFVIICGMWTMYNFLYAGYVFISAQSDSKAMSTVRESITMTAIGLAIIAGAYLLAGLIGLIFFHDATFILNPKVTGAIDLK